MYTALFLSPMIPSYNLKKTAAFFQHVLDFTPVMHTETYAIYEKNNLSIHLLPAGDDIGQMEFYLEIDDINSFWSSIKDRLSGLKVKEPFNQDYGMREIHIGIPETNTLLFIGQDLSGK